jgi:hypothetical protein
VLSTTDSLSLRLQVTSTWGVEARVSPVGGDAEEEEWRRRGTETEKGQEWRIEEGEGKGRVGKGEKGG